MHYKFRTSQELREEILARTLGDEKKWYGTLSCTPKGQWDSSATQLVERFKETSHPVFKSISAVSGGILKKESMAEIPYTSMLIHRSQNSCFAQFTKEPAQYVRSSLKLV